jgi:HSP20 family protein
MPTKKVLFDELMGMKKRMDRLYAESFSKLPDESISQPDPVEWRPLLDVVETDDAWVVLADLPGVTEDDLEVRVDQTQLIIRGVRHSATASSEASGVISSERPVGRFVRELPLPEALKGAQVSAELNKGVLTVTLQKSESPSRKIKVQPE